MSAATTPDGGSAFPFHHTYASGDAREDFGLSKRDYFAGQALAGLLAQGTQGTFSKPSGVTCAAAWAYEYADAMLKAREQ
jgi:hypothetical protein